MPKVAESTVRRLSLYLRFLEEFEGQGIATVSSGALASRGGTTSAQVRKDLSFFGSFGKRGLGYPVPELADQLREILGLKRRYRVGMIGAGKIGGIACGLVPIVALHGVVLARNQRAPHAVPGTRISVEESERIAVGELRLLCRDGSAFGIAHACIHGEARGLARLCKLDGTFDGQIPRMPQVELRHGTREEIRVGEPGAVIGCREFCDR